MYDTVALKSPPITFEQREKLLEFCSKIESLDLGTGELNYCFTTGALVGSYDYRIRMNVDNRDWVRVEGALAPVMVETDWYLKIECSIHKLMNHHNCYGGPRDIQKSVKYLVKFIEDYTGTNLPYYLDWEVERIDTSKIFVFKSSQIVKRVVANLRNDVYSRRKTLPYENGVMFPGAITTDKFYWKWPEFKEHDYKRFSKYIAVEVDKSYSENDGDLKRSRLAMFKMKMDKVLERAMRTIRFEVEIKSRKLKELFNAEIVTVRMLDDKKLHGCMEDELRKCIKEREDMDVVRRSDLVEERLDNMYGIKLASCLYSMWAKMVQYGENHVKEKMSKATFYRYKKLLLDAGISWVISNLNLNIHSIVPEDFSFLNNKYVDDTVSQEVTEKLAEVA